MQVGQIRPEQSAENATDVCGDVGATGQPHRSAEQDRDKRGGQQSHKQRKGNPHPSHRVGKMMSH
jgi:hypothetical protein